MLAPEALRAMIRIPVPFDVLAALPAYEILVAFLEPFYGHIFPKFISLSPMRSAPSVVPFSVYISW